LSDLPPAYRLPPTAYRLLTSLRSVHLRYAVQVQYMGNKKSSEHG
jgi:hypothetical protein